MAVLVILPRLVIGIMAVAGVFVAIFTKKIDTLNTSPIKSLEVVLQITVADSVSNSSMDIYITKDTVTAARLD